MLKSSLFLSLTLLLVYDWSFVRGGVLKSQDEEVLNQGLYVSTDKVEILLNTNFKTKLYNKPYAWLIQFYNSWCGHCRRFAPVYKEFAATNYKWRNVVHVGTIDCAQEDNNAICRDFEIMEYPTLRYFNPNYVEGNNLIGEKFSKIDSVTELNSNLAKQLAAEQLKGNGKNWPDLSYHIFDSAAHAMQSVPADIKYLFLIFENTNSTIGMEVALDLMDIHNVRQRRVSINSPLVQQLGVNTFPSLYVVGSDENPIPLHQSQSELSRKSFTQLIRVYLGLPEDEDNGDKQEQSREPNVTGTELGIRDVVYLGDLETALRYSLNHEITSHKEIQGEKLIALKNYLAVLIKYFPFSANGKDFMQALNKAISQQSIWAGADLVNVIKNLESVYAPVYSTPAEWIGCKGSTPAYRGYTCAVWTMFHTLSIKGLNDDQADDNEVLIAMHGYIEHFFGCADCTKHFLEMSAKNKIFEVVGADKAALWLWVAHNEVNLRLAGDSTEDPNHPKIQYPSKLNCPTCRDVAGSWNLQEMLDYLRKTYTQIKMQPVPRASSGSPLSNLDMGLVGLLYILSFVILLLVIRLFLTKRFYRKKVYSHSWGKV